MTKFLSSKTNAARFEQQPRLGRGCVASQVRRTEAKNVTVSLFRLVLLPLFCFRFSAN